MEEIDDTIISKILEQSYYKEPVCKINTEDIDLVGKNILLLCGSGITKDYGIDTFEEMKQKNYYDVFSMSSYETDTLEFYRYLNAIKTNCLRLSKIKNDKSTTFIVTTNIDGMFVGDNVFELHGSIFEYKCNHCKTMDIITEVVEIPLCKTCGHILRPNIQLYGDGNYTFNENQKKNYSVFKQNMVPQNTIVFEVGCGLGVPYLRHESESLKKKGFDVYRVNIKDFDTTTKSVALSGKQFLEKGIL
jgi:NAD-dependent SIR2 family protein deacetylase